MDIKKTVVGLLAALALSWACAAYAADNGTEFGIEDDLTVLGTGGTAVDPDAEIKGFTVFGATQAAPALQIPVAPGNIFVNGYVQLSSGMYVAGSSTFTSGAYLAGISSFTAGPGSIYISGGGANQVLKKVAGGAMVWGDDSTGLPALGTARRLQMITDAGTGLMNSAFLQNAGDTNITMISGSSLTILGDGTNGLGVTGATTLSGAVSILGINTFTVGTGLATLGGALNVTGASTLTGALTVNNYAQFGSGVAKSTFSTAGALDMANNANITLLGTAKITLPNLPALGTDAANKNYVDNQIGAGGQWTRDNALSAVKLSTITDNVGIGIAAPGAELHVSKNNAAAADYLLIVSSGPLAGNNRFAIQADGTANLTGSLTASGNLAANGNSQLGDAAGDIHGVNMSAASGTALSVAGEDAAGKYVAQFYSGVKKVAWLKQK